MRELSQHVMDLVENSTAAGATSVLVEILRDTPADKLVLRVEDNGRGMDLETAQRATDPFFTTRKLRRVGLGLPLLAVSAERCGGDLRILSGIGEGTVVTATFRLSNIDTPPLGDLASTMMCAFVGHPDVSIRYRYSRDGRCFELDSGVISAELEEVPISHPLVIRWLEKVIPDGLAAVEAIAAQEEEANAQAEQS